MLSKPVARPVFVVSKFLGVTGAVFVAHYICTIALLMSVRHGVLESMKVTHDLTVIATAAGVLGLALLLSAFFNYLYDWKFSSTAVMVTAILATFGIVFLSLFDKQWRFNPAGNGMNLLDVYGAILLFFGAMVIVALAVTLSARFNMVVTLAGCVGIFLLGLVSDYAFGRFADTALWAKIGRIIVPNLQVFWISDAIYEGSRVPLKYVLIGGAYAVCYTAGILSLAVALFQKRQVG